MPNRYKKLVLDEIEKRTKRQRATFKKLINKEETDLCGRNIAYIFPGWIFACKEFHNIKLLSLFNNNLKGLDLDALKGLQSLIWLNLSCNKLKDIDLGIFDSNLNLDKLIIFISNTEFACLNI